MSNRYFEATGDKSDACVSRVSNGLGLHSFCGKRQAGLLPWCSHGTSLRTYASGSLECSRGTSRYGRCLRSGSPGFDLYGESFLRSHLESARRQLYTVCESMAVSPELAKKATSRTLALSRPRLKLT